MSVNYLMVRRILSILLFILFLSWLFLLYAFSTIGRVKPAALSQESTRNLTILLWYRPWSNRSSVDEDTCWDQFKIPGCKLTERRSDFMSADVVVFHHEELMTGQETLPLKLPRPPFQKWAWMSYESPAWNLNLKDFSNIFHMTVNYRRDADVYAPYAELRPKKDERRPAELARPNKTHLACWVVSNYQNHHNRSKVYNELKKFIPIQVYGRWVGRWLPYDSLLPTLQQCYFYLAFENAHFKDYITEKFWRNAFLGGAVPVVMGAPLEDYKAVAPPHSFIHIDEFFSVKHLAEFLKELAKNEDVYNDYFDWKQKWEVKELEWKHSLCKICTVYDNETHHKVYSDLHAWATAGST